MSIDDLNKRRRSLLRFGFSMDPNQPSVVDFELDQKEFGVLGFAMVHWSFMEHALLQTTIALADAIGVEVSTDVRQDSFRRRLDAFRKVTAQIDGAENRRQFAHLASRIAKENGFRQKLAHGIWHYDAADPDILHVEVSRHGADGPTEFLNTKRIFEFARRVGAISFELLHPGGYTMDDYAADHTGVSFSRSFIRMMTGKE
jgi:hypothetical protein